MTTTRWLIVGGAVAALAGCGAQDPSSPSGTWAQVKEQTTCEAVVPNSCVGVFGFTVQNGGQFVVGPADTGAQITGALTTAEAAQLSADVTPVVTGLGPGPQCDSTITLGGVSDHVDLMESRYGVSRVFDQGGTPGTTCYRGGKDRSIQLHADLAALMAKYYPRPFP